MQREFIQTAMTAARDAGAYLMEHFGSFIESEIKADKSRVTEFDKQAERMICGELLGAWPDHSIIGEEGGVSGSMAEYTWVIDPLDGTHNYIRGIPEFGVSIGLLKKGEFFAGVIYLPFDDELYAAEKGAGAYKNGSRIHVSPITEIRDATLLYDSGMKNNPEKKCSFLSRCAGDMFNVRIFGASVRNLTWLAEGKGDVLIEFDEHLWDFAAGITIAAEAGGVITGHHNEPLTSASVSYVATNGHLHPGVLSYFSKG